VTDSLLLDPEERTVKVITKKGRVRETHLWPCEVASRDDCTIAPLRVSWLYTCAGCNLQACRLCFDKVLGRCVKCGGVSANGIH
jgi:hypothetical protein